jgi:hypothetical protein
LIKLQTLLMLSFTFELFIEILSPMSGITSYHFRIYCGKKYDTPTLTFDF